MSAVSATLKIVTANEQLQQQEQQPLLQSKVPPTVQPPSVPPPSVPPTYDQATTQSVNTTTHHVVVVGPTSTPYKLYGTEPVDIECPFCHNFTRTRIRHRPTSRTHLFALLFCLFQLYCCICLPYCMDSCMNANHYCGICDKYLGTYMQN